MWMLPYHFLYCSFSDIETDFDAKIQVKMYLRMNLYNEKYTTQLL